MGLHECGLPEDKLPQCWNDDVRMNALFAPFRLKTANPESWEMKMKFWSDMIRQWCRVKGDPIVSASDAKVAFQRKGRTPACIDIVVEEMYRSGDLVPITKYQQILQTGPEGWVRWGARLAFKPAAIALTAVSSLMPGRQVLDSDGLPKASIESTQRFVLESVLKEQATSLLSDYPAHHERVGTIDELIKRSEWSHGRESFELSLGWLLASGGATVKGDIIKLGEYTLHHYHRYPAHLERVSTIDELIKRSEWSHGRESFELSFGWLLASGGATVKGDIIKLAEPSKKVSDVTKSDEALVNLSQAEARLEADATRFAREADNAHRDAQAQYALGNKPAAKNHLRRRHRASQRLKKCEGALDNVRQLLQNLRDTEHNRAIVDTYKSTSAAMKESGLNEDAVHDTMDDLKDVMDTYNEVEKALSGTVEDVDAAELEAELLELLATPAGSAGSGGERNEKNKTEVPVPSAKPRRNTDGEFVFDGEERIIAELNELGIEDSSPPARNTNNNKVPIGEWDTGAQKSPKRSPKQSQDPSEASKSKAWYPPSAECLRSDAWNNNFAELRQDERIHPGQTLNIDFSTPSHLYNNDFLVRDHTSASRVWLYNARDCPLPDADTLTTSTEYYSGESPGKVGGNFQMAPGGERAKPSTNQPGGERAKPTTKPSWSEADPMADIERRLQNLRGYNS